MRCDDELQSSFSLTSFSNSYSRKAFKKSRLTVKQPGRLNGQAAAAQPVPGVDDKVLSLQAGI